MRSLSWINGTLTYEPHVSAHDRGFLVADGVFETMRVEDNNVADFDAHFARMSSGLIAFELQLAYSKEQLKAAAHELIAKVLLGAEISRLRLTVTRGAPGAGSTVFMSLSPQPTNSYPLELVLTDIVRVAGNPSSMHKTLAYTDNFFAQRQVARQGENRVAVLCNQWGRVACGSIGNVFVKRNDQWITPPVAEGALSGITRGKLLAAGSYQGLPVKESEVLVDAFLDGEVLLTNVLRGVEQGTSVLRGN